jgi:hypothetical protein
LLPSLPAPCDAVVLEDPPAPIVTAYVVCLIRDCEVKYTSPPAPPPDPISPDPDPPAATTSKSETTGATEVIELLAEDGEDVPFDPVAVTVKV